MCTCNKEHLTWELSVYVFKVCMKRNFHARFFSLHQNDQLKSQYNFFDRIFVTALLFVIFNFILFENNTTSDAIVHNHFSKKLY